MMGHWAMNEDLDWILYTALSVFVVIGFALLMQWILPRVAGGQHSKAEESPLEILSESHAWEEITQGEYKEEN